ncbi:hypothetical protein [Helicobacter pylori]|uniref:hypothetical protein n=1 Tax=Helicobacter pylori TaxID=210 RepID=UPI001FD60141|nr:hypothetical protein [Helicobacter pylori]UOS47247.1 hypothetical protein MPG09_03760 [Helicobacter pylori]
MDANAFCATFNLKNFLLVLVKYNAFVQSLLKLGSFLLINLSNVITTAINNANAFEINEINLTSAIIDKIEYHFRDNTFHFIFDVGNPLLKESSQLVVEVPREALDLENVDELVKSILLLNNNLKFHVSEGKLLPNNNLECYISKGSYIIDLCLIDD